MKPKDYIWLFRRAYTEWNSDNVRLFSAAVAYFSLFSLAPLLLIAIAIAGFIFGHATAQEHVISEITGTVGDEGALILQKLMGAISVPTHTIAATSVGVGIIMYGASRVFWHMQEALNSIWKIRGKRIRGIKGFLHDQLLSFATVLLTGLLLFLSLLSSTTLSMISKYSIDLNLHVPLFWKLLNLALSFGGVTILFALLFKVLPNVKIKWSDVWLGALTAAILFGIGKYLIGLYLTYSSVSSTYGAAGSLVILLVWIYYSAMIFFFGAELSQIYTSRFGSGRERSA